MEVNNVEGLLIQYQNTTDATMYLQINIQIIFKNISLNLNHCMFTLQSMLILQPNDVKVGNADSFFGFSSSYYPKT